MSKLRSIFELSTEEAFNIAVNQFGIELPPLEAVENEDWGRDYVLQKLRDINSQELARLGLTWEPEKED